MWNRHRLLFLALFVVAPLTSSYGNAGGELSQADSRFKLSFPNPANYIGPVVDGWPPGKSRDMARYVAAETVVVSNTSCLRLQGRRLLVLVRSALRNVERRQANRETWMRHAGSDVSVVHVTGTTAERGLQAAVKEEATAHCDVLQVDVGDAYTNNTLKSVSALHFVVVDRRVEPAFVLVTDDDSYVNLPLLRGLLFGRRRRLLASGRDLRLVGFRYPGSAILRPSPNSNGSSPVVPPSVCPDYMFDGKAYPAFLSGGAGYVAASAALPCLLRECLRMPFFHIDDVFVTGFAAERCGFPRVHSGRFSSGRVALDAVRRGYVAIHYADADGKRDYDALFTSPTIRTHPGRHS